MVAHLAGYEFHEHVEHYGQHRRDGPPELPP
jgi:hypothetical protein